MYNDHKVITWTAAGRREYMEVQYKYLLTMNKYIDEHWWCVNTEEPEDVRYIDFLCNSYPTYFKKVEVPDPYPQIRSARVSKFYPKCLNDKTVYIKMDDDILWFETESFDKFLKFRIENPQYFLVFGNTVNNSLCTHLHQRLGAVNLDSGIADYSAEGNAWRGHQIAEVSHRDLFYAIENNEVDKFKFRNHVLFHKEKVSINFISWLGTGFQRFGGKVNDDDERFLSEWEPRRANLTSTIYGDFVVSHLAFFTQRQKMNRSIYLKYKELSQRIEI